MPVTLRSSRGFALLAALLLLLLLSAIAVGVVYMATTETRLGSTDRENTLAYYGAEAGMEKMMADLSQLYAVSQSPTVAQIQALGAPALRPVLPGVTYPEYVFTVPNVGGIPTSEVRNISSGPNEGLVASIIPMSLTVTARRVGGEEVKMTRSIEVALIPVFQFGIFSDTDLSYFPGPVFNFAGRVHTNGNLFLAAGSGLTFRAKITAVRDVVRRRTANTRDAQTDGRNGAVRIPTAPNGCDGAQPACRAIGWNEASKQDGPDPPPTWNPGSADNVNWPNISTTTYNGLILNGDTGAKALDLPFVAPGLRSIEIIRQPPPGELPTSLVGLSRLYNQAQIRVLLADTVAELPGGAGDPENIRLWNEPGTPPYNNGVPVPSAANRTFFASGMFNTDNGWVRIPSTLATNAYYPLLDGKPTPAPFTEGGWLRVEHRRADLNFYGVTREWLELGFARGLLPPRSEAPVVTNTVHPNAILILQMLADRNNDGDTADLNESGAPWGAANRDKFFPINLYDPREGEVRDEPALAGTSCALGGIMNVVELDVRNLRRWLTGAIGATGTQTEFLTQNGYILYFSDRRGAQPSPAAGGVIVGEYGYEDIINLPIAAGTPNGALDNGEDVNGNGVLDNYSNTTLGDGFIAAAQGGLNANDSPIVRLDNVPAGEGTCVTNGRKNRVTGPRHALKLINGSRGNLPERPDGTGGFTVGSENPVYIQGNYNANTANQFNDPAPEQHAAAAVIADAVTLLSNNWRDINSFTSPTTPGGRTGTTTWYRLAIAAGKNLNYPWPAWAGSNQDVGLDGGTHNFLRYIERWSGQTLNYLGSMVSLYYAEYGVGVYKCCTRVYSPPVRAYSFDTEFLNPAKLPPGTPTFRDVVNLGFQQVFTPN